MSSAKETENRDLQDTIDAETRDAQWKGRDDQQAESKAGATPLRDESKASLSPAEVVEKVSEYFYMDEELGQCFENFVDSHADSYDLTSTEMKLEYTSIYNSYKDLFEEKIGGYIINSLGSSIEIFYEALQAKTTEDANSTEAIFGQILASVTDFDIFATMLKEQAIIRAKKAAKEAAAKNA